MNFQEVLQLAEHLEHNLPAAMPGEPAAGQPIHRLIDHTLLKPEATPEQVKLLCVEAVQYQFAAVCVNPIYTEMIVALLKGSSVAPCAVAGFPLGAVPTSHKVFETRQAVELGVRELDMVLPVGMLKSGNLEAVYQDIAAVVAAAHPAGVLIKVIFETCLLTTREKILACLLSKQAGADFVKTSTGFASGGATVEDIRLMRGVVGTEMGVKASGGVRSLADALAMISAGANRLGTSSGLKIMQEYLAKV